MQAVSTNAVLAAPKTDLRARITGTHGAVLAVLTLGLSANTLAGSFWGIGTYPFLLTNHIVAVGLIQAYLLMGVLASLAFFAARSVHPLPRVWHGALITAHLIPLLAVAIYISSTAEMTVGIAMISLGIHGVGIAAEIWAMTRKD